MKQEETWGRPERPQQLDPAVQKLRKGLALLVCDVKHRVVDVREDGTPVMAGPSVFADLDDELYEGMNWCKLNGIKFTLDPIEKVDHVLLVLTEDWHQSIHCTKQVMVARKKKLPIYSLNLQTGRIFC